MRISCISRHGAGSPPARAQPPSARALPPLLQGPPSPLRRAGKAAGASLAVLRGTLARLERPASGPRLRHLSLGLPQVEQHLPGPGLACGVLHEMAAAAHGDRPAAFGFLCALTAAALRARPGPAVLVAARQALADFGTPYGHGLARLGLDVGRLLIVDAKTDKDALWAIEDALRSGAPAVVAGAIASLPDLTVSRRLNLAAGAHGVPLLVLRAPSAAGVSAAATRWRIAAAPAARDRFGAFAHVRWSVALERCRNGRPGHWLIEWNHVAHRFRVVEGVADRAPAQRPDLRRAG